VELLLFHLWQVLSTIQNFSNRLFPLHYTAQQMLWCMFNSIFSIRLPDLYWQRLQLKACFDDDWPVVMLSKPIKGDKLILIHTSEIRHHLQPYCFWRPLKVIWVMNWIICLHSVTLLQMVHYTLKWYTFTWTQPLMLIGQFSKSLEIRFNLKIITTTTTTTTTIIIQGLGQWPAPVQKFNFW